MIIGDVFLWLAGGATAAAFLIYLAPVFSDWKLPVPGRWVYALSAVFISLAAVLLLTLLLRQRYDIAYVFGYTSRDLELMYRISAFWAGQEGSFLFWALIGGWVGLFLARSAKSLEGPTMVFWCLAQGVLITMLIAKSPFAPMDQPAMDGQGLNPILRDPWMAIHPPMLFLGFVGMTVPACLAAGALVAGRFGDWARVALPWTSFGWLTLGAGIVLGGLWAYEVLGWGGYWGWDPVENSSLVPWITGTVLLHGLIIQRRKNTSERANIIFALLTYLLVLYSTFLTRSGVLGDFSVHSFSDLGVAAVLNALMVVMLFVFAVLVAIRYRRILSPPIVENPEGKEANLYLMAWVLSAISILVLLGTSMPVITSILNPEKPSGVGQHFYNTTTGPLTGVLLALLALSPLMAWSAKAASRATTSSGGRWLGLASLGAFIVFALLAMLMGISTGMLLTIAVLSLLGLVVNLYWFVRSSLATGVMRSSAFLAHAGFALMFLGIAGSNLGRAPLAMRLDEGGEPGRAFGWTITLERVRSTEAGALAADLSLRPLNGQARKLTLSGAQMPGGGYAFKPFIHRTILRDTYFAPEQIEPAGTGGGEDEPGAEALPNSEEVTPEFIAGAAGVRGESATTQDGQVSVNVTGMSVEERSVRLSVTIRGESPRPITLARGQTVQVGDYRIQFERFGPMETSADGGTKVQIVVRVASSSGAVAPAAARAAEPESSGIGYVNLRVSDKPLMTFLWAGVLMMGLSSLLAVVRRFQEKAGRDEV